MNKSDSDIMAISMEEEGFTKTDSIDDADFVIYNTCSVRQNAENRVLARIESIRQKIHNHGGKIIVAGCMAQRLGTSLIDSEHGDLVIGPYEAPRIGSILKKDSDAQAFLSQSKEDFAQRLGKHSSENKHQWHSFVTITHGCENFCSYCIVPYVRGPLISYASKDILDHVDQLIERGITEVTLLGQNVNQYSQDNDDIPFYKLLDAVASKKEIKRVGFLTSHPKDFSKNIIDVINNHENCSRAIHLPLQSGSDRILKSMNRHYTRDHYMKIIEDIDKTLNDYAVSTDLIVGFPGETHEEFNDTLEAVKEIRFDEAFMYAYSPREGTPATSLKDDLPRDKKIDRLNQLIETQRAITLEKLLQRIGKREKIILEGFSKRSSDMLFGKTFLNHSVVVSGNESDCGKEYEIKVTGIQGTTLHGEIL